jgi:hypothetical protein
VKQNANLAHPRELQVFGISAKMTHQFITNYKACQSPRISSFRAFAQLDTRSGGQYKSQPRVDFMEAKDCRSEAKSLA